MKNLMISTGIILLLIGGGIPFMASLDFEQEPLTFFINDDGFYSDARPPGVGNSKPSEDPPAQQTEELPWGVERINADHVHGSYTGEGIRVAVLDTGIDLDHPDLSSNIAGGRNFVPKGKGVDPSNYNDDNGHGTHVAGTIAAIDNDIGVIGVAPSVQLLAVKVLDRRGSGAASWVADGIRWAADPNGGNADIISMSLSSDYPNSDIYSAVKYAIGQGVLIIAAAGNDYQTSVDYPAAYSEVLAVSATGTTNMIASFSNIGPQIQLAAPGVSIKSTWNDGAYNTISGTSMATPHVTGVAALVWQKNGAGYTYTQVWNDMISNALDLGSTGKDNLYGYGLVDAAKSTGITVL